MKELLILSGKGGTGKTTIASALIKIHEAKAYADCDVDAPNLHLISQIGGAPERKDYYGLPKSQIDLDLCTSCDLCRQHCRFDAIHQIEGQYRVDPFACEGCGVCKLVCPVGAAELYPAVAGDLMLYKEDETVFSTAQLRMGNGTSGLLVTEVKKQMKAETGEGVDLAIIDGSPGIGCPVIASISGVDLVLLVAEPSLSGISDMGRVVETANKFGIKTVVCVNKYDTNHENTDKIKEYCQKLKLAYVGEIPYDAFAIEAINSGKTIVDIDCPSGEAVKELYKKTMEHLFN